MLIEENKWRAVRYGMEGQLIDFGKREAVPTRVLVEELLDFVSEAADIFHTQDDLDRVRTICREGTSADRQTRIFKETGSLKAVVDDLTAETTLGT
jgi:carboxylate-amine ligase